MPDLLLEEDWAHRAATIRHLDFQLSGGEGLGGPAAGRALEATRRLPRNLTPGDYRRLGKDKTLRVYENPAAIALCIFDESKALCRKLEEGGKDTRPDLLTCVDSCSNIARTDDHIASITHQMDKLRAEAKLAPLPMAQSMLAQADRNERIVASFGASRILLSDAREQPSTVAHEELQGKPSE
ncbi:hypothetical protein ACFSFX_15570 [Arthrobacter flavus]|uniref:DUF222 domain-containing protein n=1 Tax=Arthrobacter flavus TaxID=95172 RepID=A0ABW4QBC7_9MICC